MQPGRVREQIARSYREWMGLLVEQAQKAQELGELDGDTDVEQLVFELNGVLVAANFFFLPTTIPAELERARRAVRERPGIRAKVSGRTCRKRMWFPT